MGLLLKNYQFKAIKKILEHDKKKLIIAMDTGTGKTIVALTLIKLLEKDMKKILIVVPSILIKNVWIYDNKRFFGLDITIVKGKAYIKKIYKNKIIIISYGVLQRNIKEVKKIEWDMIIYDEAHKLGNRKTRLTKAVIGRFFKGSYINKLTASRVYLFTGTLIPNREEQVYSQLIAVGLNESWTSFKNRFFYNPSQMLPYYVKFKQSKRQEFNNLISQYTIVVDKKDTELNEIGKYFNYIEFQIPNNIKKIQDKLKKTGVYEINEYTHITIDYNIQAFVKFRQLSSGFIKVNDKIIDLSNLRLDIFDEFIQDRAKQEPFIVWYSFSYERDKIIEILKKRKIKYWEVSGRIKTSIKNKNISEFKETKNGVLLIQYNTGKLGLTFINCNKMVYYSLIDDNETFIQSQDRIHRIGQNKECYYYILKCDGSIDNAILKSLRNKTNILDTLKAWIKNKED